MVLKPCINASLKTITAILAATTKMIITDSIPTR